jgi:hypothetical protein
MNIYSVLSMVNKTLSIGMVIGTIVTATLVIATLFSNETATAQVMQHQQQMQHQPTSGHQQQGMHHSMFNANGMSMVQDVRISGVSITGDNTVSINLTHAGNGTSPSITIIAMTNHMETMNMMMGGGHMDMGMMNQGMMDIGGMNNTGGMMGGGHMDMGMMGNTTSDMMMPIAGSQTGSAVVNSGWHSGSSISILLEGDGSAHEASDIHVMVFPHLT